MQNLNIALVQTSIEWEAVKANLVAIENKLQKVNGVDLIVLPEMFTTGFSMNVEKFSEPMNGPTMLWMHRQADKHDCVIAGSLIIEENGKYYNRLIWMKPDGTALHYDKRHLFRMADENNYFDAGQSRMQVFLKGWKICPLICYDLRFPVWSRNYMLEYDLLLYIANWPQRRELHWKSLLQARAIENQVYVAGLNRVGQDGNGLIYNGHSMVISPRGEHIIAANQDEDILQVELDYLALQQYRKEFPAYKDADDFEIK